MAYKARHHLDQVAFPQPLSGPASALRAHKPPFCGLASLLPSPEAPWPCVLTAGASSHFRAQLPSHLLREAFLTNQKWVPACLACYPLSRCSLSFRAMISVWNYFVYLFICLSAACLLTETISSLRTGLLVNICWREGGEERGRVEEEGRKEGKNKGK